MPEPMIDQESEFDPPLENDVVQAELVEAEIVDDEVILEDDGPGEDDDDEDDRAELALREANSIAPWSPIPTRLARAFIDQNPDAELNVVFPEVYEEDRTAKIKDLATAQSLGSISHQRMSERIAKELGEENYHYDEEMEQIQLEMQLLPSDVNPDIATPGPDPNSPPIAAQIGRSVVGLPAPGQKGMQTPGTINFGTPAPGLATERPLAQPVADGAVPPEPKRQDLSGPATARFRKLQRQSTRAIRRLTDRLLEMERREVQSTEQLIRLFSGIEKQIVAGAAHPDLQTQMRVMLEQMTREYEGKLDRLVATLREATKKDPAPPAPPPPQAAEIHVNLPKESQQPGTVKIIHRDAETGLIQRIEERPLEPPVEEVGKS